jgi:hypothetical protein
VVTRAARSALAAPSPPTFSPRVARALGVAWTISPLACSSADPSSEASPTPGPASDDGGGAIAKDGGNDPLSPEGGKPGQGDDAGTSPGEGGGAGDAAPDGGAGRLRVVMGTGGAPGHIVDGDGNVVMLHGADRSGTEFACLSGNFSDGPVDQAGVDAMKAWHVNAVRVPLNEDCWLGINGVPAAYSGAAYQAAVKKWVDLLTSNGMVAILDLHWTAAGASLSNAQQPMPDADHAPTLWSQVATTFASNGAVIFDLFNEPYVTDWTCWTSGGACAQANGATYTVAGMAALLQAVRNAGANNVVILGGLAYSSDLSQWVASVNSIPKLPAPLSGISIANVAASWHAYDFNGQSGCPSQYNGYSAAQKCNSAQTTATNTSATSVLAAGFPVVIGEVGISAFSASSAGSFSAAQVTDLEGWFDGMLTWAEGQGQGYLAWSWNTDTDPVLVTDYTGTPTIDFGLTYQAHLKKL